MKILCIWFTGNIAFVLNGMLAYRMLTLAYTQKYCRTKSLYPSSEHKDMVRLKRKYHNRCVALRTANFSQALTLDVKFGSLPRLTSNVKGQTGIGTTFLPGYFLDSKV